MTWYFHDSSEPIIHAVTPRVASTSQRDLYKSLTQLTERSARTLANAGCPVKAVLREPMERSISAYRRHKPGNMIATFEDYVIDRSRWDSHVMPQTLIHSRNGVTPTRWVLFEHFVQDLPTRRNATPQSHIRQHTVDTSEEFRAWFNITYRADIQLYEDLKRKAYV